MRKILFTLLCAFSALFFLPVSTHATDYTIFPDASVPSYALPISYFHQSSYYGSISQQIYWAEELTDQGASAGDINSITFYYTAAKGTTADAFSRSIEIWLMEVANTTDVYSIETVPWTSGSGNDYLSAFLHNGTTKKAGVKVFDGSLATESVTSSNPINFATDIKSVTLPISSFSWDGSKNIVMTVIDKTNTKQSSANLRFLIASTKVSSTSYPRFTYTKWIVENDERLGWISDFSGAKYGDHYPFSPTSAQKSDQAGQRSYVNKVTFSISATIPAPTHLAASSITTSSATLSWDDVADATGYNVRWGKTSGSLDHSATNVTNTYLDIDELEDGTTYYFAVQTVTAGGTSAYTAPANFETTATTMEYKGIDFSKWTSTTTMPTAGAYYLRNDVGLSASVTLTDDLQLCLHGNTLYTSTYHIIVPDGMTLSIFNDTGDGLINGGFMENLGHGGIIEIQDGGTLIICEGQVMNIAGNDSYAIYNNGNLQLSGAPVIAGGSADIYLGNGKVITISGALSNSAPYSVQKALVGDFTSGWNTQMGSANPANYFSSANDTYGVVRNGNEARMVKVLAWSESTTNSSIGENSGQMVNVNLTRSLTSSQYNTFCLPFALDDDQLQELFGAGYDLEEFVSSSLEGDVLSLVFSNVTSLEAGKPYLLQPSVDVANPSFEGVTIAVTAPADQASDANISFHGTFAPTELEGSNKNLLFLGAGNELFWPEETGNLKGFRAYFEVKGSAAKAAKQARIVKNENHTQAIDNIESNGAAQKRIIDGQLVIEKNGILFNAQGQMVK